MDKPVKCVYKFSRPADMPINFIHGVFGGLTQHGELEINFYTESQSLPQSVERVISPEGILIDENTTSEDTDTLHHFDRQIVSRIILNRETAHLFSNWLLDQLDQLDEFKEMTDNFSDTTFSTVANTDMMQSNSEEFFNADEDQTPQEKFFNADEDPEEEIFQPKGKPIKKKRRLQ